MRSTGSDIFWKLSGSYRQCVNMGVAIFQSTLFTGNWQASSIMQPHTAGKPVGARLPSPPPPATLSAMLSIQLSAFRIF